MTLGGLLSLRGSVWLLSSGAAVSGLHSNFRLIGGGAVGSIGGLLTWVLGIVGCIAIIALLVNSRRQRQKFGFPVRPMWAEVLLGVLGCAIVIGVVAFANANYWPPGLATQYAQENGITEPPGGLKISVGFPWPVILVIAVTVVMTFIATRRRFGRYVYAYGGNPDAAELAGINTRWTIMKTFMLMGVLCAIAAAISSARLNGSTLDVGSERRALRHRRRRRWWHVVRGRHRHHPRCRAGRVRHAVAGLRDELQRRQLPDPERGGRHRPHHRRWPRHV